MQHFEPCMSILPTSQKELWPLLSSASNLNFVLYGGTAIALRLGHRISVDFDFFTDQMLNRHLMDQSFSFLQRSKVLQESSDTLTIQVPTSQLQSSPVKVSFFGGINFGRVGHPELTSDGVLKVASLIDLLATKVKVILQRVEAKDYLDIAALIQAGVKLEDGLASACQLFGSQFQPSESLKALVYFKGGDLDSISQVTKSILLDAVKNVGNLPRVKLLSNSLS